MRDVAVLGVGMHPFGKFNDKSVTELCRTATEAALRDAKQETMEQYNEGIALFRQRQWRQSHKIFKELMEKLPTDKVVEIYEQRSRIFAEKPPETDEMIVSRFDHK